MVSISINLTGNQIIFRKLAEDCLTFGSSLPKNWSLMTASQLQNDCVESRFSINFIEADKLILHLMVSTQLSSKAIYYFWTWLTSWLAVNLADYFSIYLPPIIFGHTNHLMLAAPARFNMILTLLCNILITTYLSTKMVFLWIWLTHLTQIMS